MRAVRYDGHGGIDQIYVADVPDPEAAPGRVVVRVLATSINRGLTIIGTGSRVKGSRQPIC